MYRTMFVVALSVLTLAATAAVQAADEQPGTPGAQGQQKKSAQEAYGWQLMTPEERGEYRAKMHSAKTQVERDKLRAEHHKVMTERAKEKGVTLPDDPPMRPRPGGPHGGMGPRANPPSTNRLMPEDASNSRLSARQLTSPGRRQMIANLELTQRRHPRRLGRTG